MTSSLSPQPHLIAAASALPTLPIRQFEFANPTFPPHRARSPCGFRARIRIAAVNTEIQSRWRPAMPTKTDQIRALNDELRQHLLGGIAVITPGVAALGQEAVDRICEDNSSVRRLLPRQRPARRTRLWCVRSGRPPGVLQNRLLRQDSDLPLARPSRSLCHRACNHDHARRRVLTTRLTDQHRLLGWPMLETEDGQYLCQTFANDWAVIWPPRFSKRTSSIKTYLVRLRDRSRGNVGVHGI